MLLYRLSPITPRTWGRQAQRDDGGLTTDEKARIKELERENREFKRANDILRKASAFFAQAEPAPQGHLGAGKPAPGTAH